MTVQENTPVSETANGGEGLPATTNITDTNDTTFDFDAEIGGMKPAQDAMRKSVVRWNERVESYRDAKGASADLPKDAFKHHPAFDVLKSLFQTIWHEDEDEMSDYTLNVLTNISVGSDGLPRFDGLTRKAFSKITQSAEGMRDVAYKKRDFLMTSIAEQQFQSYSYLDCLLWEAEPIAELPVAIGIREAVY